MTNEQVKQLKQIKADITNGNLSDARGRIMGYGILSFPRDYLDHLYGVHSEENHDDLVIADHRKAMVQLSLIEL